MPPPPCPHRQPCAPCLRTKAIESEISIREHYQPQISGLEIWIHGLYGSRINLLHIREMKVDEMNELYLCRDVEIDRAWEEYESYFGPRNEDEAEYRLARTNAMKREIESVKEGMFELSDELEEWWIEHDPVGCLRHKKRLAGLAKRKQS